MKIIDGKFYDEKGNEVPLEFGNLEQIKLLKEYESRISELNEGLELDVDFETTYTASVKIVCVCGKNIFFENEADDDEDINCLDNLKKSCRSCKAEYQLFVKEDALFAKKIK